MDDSNRKIVHYTAVASLVVLSFAAQTLGSHCCRRACCCADASSLPSTPPPPPATKAWRSLDHRLVASALLAFAFGVFKQVGDALSWQWLPWCGLYHGGCHFEWLDLFLTVDGLLTGLLIIIAWHVALHQCYRRGRQAWGRRRRDIPCDPTEVMTIDGDGRGGENDHPDDLRHVHSQDFDLDSVVDYCDGGESGVAGVIGEDVCEETFDAAFRRSSSSPPSSPNSRGLAAPDHDVPSLTGPSSLDGDGLEIFGSPLGTTVLVTLSSSPPLPPRGTDRLPFPLVI